MSNAMGTILRASIVFMILGLIWFCMIAAIYYIVTLLVGIKFSLLIASAIFVLTIIFRSFYPRNIFK